MSEPQYDQSDADMFYLMEENRKLRAQLTEATATAEAERDDLRNRLDIQARDAIALAADARHRALVAEAQLTEARRQVWEEQSELLHAIYTTVRGDEKGECWTIRAYLDKHDIFHDDIQNELRLIEEACNYALRQRAQPSEK